MQSLISLSTLFDKKIFRIPDYQRGYSWEEEQLNDFWDDIFNLVDGRYHYTGMLTLKTIQNINPNNMKDEKWFVENRGYGAFHIVDGQQRITTFVILINSILNLSQEEKIEYLLGETIENIKERYIVEYNKPQNIIKAYKFGYEDNNYSSDYLRHHILGEKDGGSLIETFYTNNLSFAKEYFDKKVRKLYKNKGINGIERILKTITTNLRFNIHYIDDQFDVFVAFETMNNRGKKLSNLELLKNRLIYLSTLDPKNMLSDVEVSNIRDEINDAWSEIYYQLGKNKNNKLEEVIIEDESSLEYIGNDAFNGCFNLKNIKLPKTVDYIGSNAFNIHYDANIYLEHESIPSAWESSWNFNFANVILQEKKENIVSINEIYIDEKSPARNAIKIYLNMIEFLLENKGLKYREIYLIILGAEVYGRFLQFDDINLLIKSEKFIKDLSSYFNPQIKKYGESYKMLLSLLSSNHRYAIYLTGVGILNIFYFLNKEDIALSYLLQASSLNEKLEIELGDKIEQYDTIYSNFIYEIEKYITSIIGTEERPILNNAINTMKR